MKKVHEHAGVGKCPSKREVEKFVAGLLLCSLVFQGCFGEPTASEEVKKRIKEIEQATKDLIAETTEKAREGKQEHETVLVGIATRDKEHKKEKEGFRKLQEEQKDEIGKKYFGLVSIRETQGDIQELKKAFTATPPWTEEEITEEINAIWKDIMRERTELDDFYEKMKDIPLGWGEQWGEDYYYQREAAEAQELLPKLKAEIDAIMEGRGG